jgi:hypothetical protein
MDFGKLSNGMKLALGGGALLVVALFLPWYGAFGFNFAAFDSGFLAWGGALIAIAGAVVLLLKEMGTTEAAIGDFKTEQVAVGLGGLGFVLIVLRWLTQTNLVKFGLFIALIASAAVAYGAFMAMKDAGLDLPGRSSGSTGGGSTPPQEPYTPPQEPYTPPSPQGGDDE